MNDQMEVVHVRGRIGAYLEPAPGHPTFSLAKMAREGLLPDLHAALNKAKKTGSPVRAERVRVNSNGGTMEVNLHVVPIQTHDSPNKLFMVVFQDAAPNHSGSGKQRTAKSGPAQPASAREIERLRSENTELSDQLRTLLQDHETTTEEFKAANEEVLSTNEELQSANEELETAKEELQSANEELTTLNEELHNGNAELSLANNDLTNLFGNVDVAVVMVGSDLRVRRFTPLAEKLLNLIPADVGRRLGEIRPNIEFDDLEQLVKQVIDTATLQQREVRGKDGLWYALRGRPYRTWDSKIDGAVISLQDIDALKRSLDETKTYADALIENAREPILILDGDLRVTIANHAFYRDFEVSPAETEGQRIYELGNGQWNIPSLRDLLKKVSADNARIDDFPVQHDFPHLGPRNMILNARSVSSETGGQSVLLAIEERHTTG